jgi:hypothetical protein
VQLNRSNVDSLHHHSVNYEAPNTTAMDNLTRNMLEPITKVLGEYYADDLKKILNENDQRNIIAHVNRVKNEGIKPSSSSNSKKMKRLIEWAIESSDVDEFDSPELAAAWRAALEGVLVDNDYKLIDLVKTLNSEDVKSICGLLIDKDTYDYNVGDRLKFLGLAKRETLKNTNVRRSIFIAFAMIALSGLFFITSEIFPYVREIFGSNVERVVQISKWVFLFVFIIYSLFALYKSAKFMTSYSLTAYGEKIARRISKYRGKTNAHADANS